MHSTVFRALEFNRIRDALVALALTAPGRARAAGLEPATSPDEVRARLQTTAEGAAFTRTGGSLAISAPDDILDSLARLDVQGVPLDPLQLLGLARLLDSTTTVVAAVRRASAVGHAHLGDIVAGAASFSDEIAAVRRAIEPSGDVSDAASPALREIRESLRRQRAKLRSTLDALVHGRDTAKYLQDQIVTDRNGRYVVVVRAEHRQAIAGIVHGSSTSGASVYLEPLSTVDLNNDVVALVERERAEIHRILTALTNAFRLRGDELAATVDAAAALDELYAKVELARRMDGVAPDLVDDGRLELIGARHPLLIPAVADLVGEPGSGRAQVVASDLTIVPPTRALVISGPNTGGKTVALKAFGLLALMAQAGLLIPVEAGSRLTPFATVFADIGDDQSIAASLSTFSAHIAHLVAMDRDLEAPALVLLDEVGGGTDPVEGGALGSAIIDHFRRRGALVVATTHDDVLKSYAATTEGVMTAGFGFNPDTYAPTYRLLYGAPGRSLAFEIAERLGLPASVIADARARRSGRESQLAAHLARVDAELAALERARQAVEDERGALAASRDALLARESRLAEREASLKRRLDDRVNERLREARLEVDRIVGTLKDKADAMASRLEPGRPRLSTGDLGTMRTSARAALDAVGASTGQPAARDDMQVEPLSTPPRTGDAVFVPAFNTEAVVRGVSGTSVEVDLRGKRLRVKLSDLRRRSNGGQTTASTEPAASRRGGVLVAAAAHEAAAREINLIGETVDAAVPRLEKFLDDALLADERRLRIVHGHGTGRLRDAVRAFFRGHPLVAAVAPAPENEGGGGATIVELKD
jgi:DNA mismatch repair protein MutS2